MASKVSDDEQAIFKLFSLGISTHRDEWVFDFDASSLEAKIKFFSNTYENKRHRLAGTDFNDSELGTEIKWDHDLRKFLQRNIPVIYSQERIVEANYRPFTKKKLYYLRELNARQYQIPRIFPGGTEDQNKVICFKGPTADYFSVLATSRVPDVKFAGTNNGGTFCLPLYRYTEDGERVSNITEWGLRRINEHYRREFGERFEEAVGGERITAEDVFAYTYAVLHNPVYRHDYAIDLLREFPRLPLYHDWDAWVKMGRELLDLHIGFEDAEPYALERVDKVAPSTGSGRTSSAPRVMLRANAGDKERGEIHIDSETVLRGVPEFAWEYKLGNRTAIEWVLDQYKEKKPRDPTIAAKFNTYRFADYKEDVIDLLRRVCTVSVRTMKIVDGMAIHRDGAVTKMEESVGSIG